MRSYIHLFIEIKLPVLFCGNKRFISLNITDCSLFPEIDFGDRSAVYTRSDDLIANEDDLSEVVDTYASKRLKRGADPNLTNARIII